MLTSLRLFLGQQGRTSCIPQPHLQLSSSPCLLCCYLYFLINVSVCNSRPSKSSTLDSPALMAFILFRIIFRSINVISLCNFFLL
ncbi:hypothetical protein RchiOBHm_Chr5g0082621 [Rosa chinensis]|uniref:Uncharacterized protein n=1 Tax=Rosa chinensis TaxID=74649 RepID=A0A2P6QNC0_ROSCH|nr:hypothetical protein RchiOBHm_Chr5g0082621 [Rosa chinensis]